MQVVESAQVTPGAQCEQDRAPIYTIGSNPAERDRLRRQSDELRSHGVALLDRAGVKPGWNALDLGCGPRGTIELLSERVGLTGHVTGLDLNPEHAAQARELVQERGLADVEIAEADASHTGLPSSSFDLVHARLLLVNIPEPADVVAEMVRLVRPGGWVVGEEADCSHHVCYPPHRLWELLADTFSVTYRQDGADPDLGHRLPELFRQAGLVDVGVEARADVYPVGHPRRTVRLDIVQSMRTKIIERGLHTERELDELDRAARAHFANPDTLLMPCLYFLAWGRKPNMGDGFQDGGAARAEGPGGPVGSGDGRLGPGPGTG
jgi:SAM-dependent methyltransferase